MKKIITYILFMMPFWGLAQTGIINMEILNGDTVSIDSVFQLKDDLFKSTTQLSATDTILASKDFVTDWAVPRLGIYDPDSLTITYNAASRTITVSPVGNAWRYYLEGVKYEVTATLNETNADVSGEYHLYYDADNVLQFSTDDFDYLTDVSIAEVYYNSTIGEGITTMETHSSEYGRFEHLIDHENIGTYLVSGITIGDYTLEPASPADDDNTFSLSAGIIADEDIRETMATLNDNSNYTVIYKTGASGVISWEHNSTPYASGTYIQYNEFTGGAWQLTDLGTNKYVNYYVLKTTSVYDSLQTLIIPGETTYSFAADAYEENFSDLNLSDLFNEYLPRYKITFFTNASYSTTGKCRINNVDELIGTRVSITRTSQINYHNALLGIQGGAVGEYYHLTEAENNRVVNFADSIQANEADPIALDSINNNLRPDIDENRDSILTHLTNDEDLDLTNELDSVYDANQSKWLLNGDTIQTITSGSGDVNSYDTITQISHGFSVNTWVSYDESFSVIAAQADTAINADLLGVITEIISADVFVIQTDGIYDGGTFTEGENYYLSTTSAGTLTTSQTYNVNEIYLFAGTGMPDSEFDMQIDVGYEFTQTEYASSSDVSDSIATVDLQRVTDVDSITNHEIVIHKYNNSTPRTQTFSQYIEDTGGSGRVDYFKFKLGATNARGGQIIFGEDNGGFGESGIYFNLNKTGLYQYGSYPIVFENNSTERARISDAGNFLIGTTTDNGTDKLQVNGTVSHDEATTNGQSATFGQIKTLISDSIADFLTGTQINGLISDSIADFITASEAGQIALDTLNEYRLLQPVGNGNKTASFTHDASLYSVGNYNLSTSGAVVVSVHNLATGMMGTIFLDVGTNPSSITITGYSDAGSTELTNKIELSAIANAAGKMTSVTYTCASDGTDIEFILVYSQEP